MALLSLPLSLPVRRGLLTLLAAVSLLLLSAGSAAACPAHECTHLDDVLGKEYLPGPYDFERDGKVGLYRLPAPKLWHDADRLALLRRLPLDIAGLNWGLFLDVFASERQAAMLERLGMEPTALARDANDLTKALRSGTREYGAYHTYNELTTLLQQTADANPGLVHLTSIGTTHEGRNIWAVKVAAQVQPTPNGNPQTLVMGCHHAREIISVEIPIAVLERLVSGYGSDEYITSLLDRREVWIVPMLNPDGHQHVVNGSTSWRKNRKPNADATVGTDNNRNYAYQWGKDNNGSSPFTWADTYRGTGPWSELENQAIRALVLDNNFAISASYHSYGRQVLFPWGYVNQNTADHAVYVRQSQEFVSRNGYAYGNPAMGTIYNTNGDSDDWLYGEQTEKRKILAYTWEVGTMFLPNELQIPSLLAEALDPALWTIELAGPAPRLAAAVVRDVSTGNGDTWLNPGELADLQVTVENIGLGLLADAQVSLLSRDGNVTVVGGPMAAPSLATLGRWSLPAGSFALQVRADLAPRSRAYLSLVVTSGDGRREIPFTLPVYDAERYTAAAWHFTDSAEGWVATGSGWSFGQPSGGGGGQYGYPDPSSGYTGDLVWGNNLSGNYAHNISTSSVISPVFDLSTSFDSVLRFRRWLNIEGTDLAAIEVKSGTVWRRVWTNPGNMSENSWQLIEYDISGWVDGRNNAQVRFLFQSDSSIAYSGWNIDDVEIVAFRPWVGTPTPTATPTSNPTSSPTPEITSTPTSEPTDTPTPEPSPTSTQTPTDTPSSTPSPTTTPSPTSTPSPTPPHAVRVYLAGYWFSRLYSGRDGRLTVLAYSPDTPEVPLLLRVPGESAGLTVSGADADGILLGEWTLPGLPAAPQRLLLELAPQGSDQAASWPYLQIE